MYLLMNLHLASKIIKNEVYALVVEGSVDIQGLIALHIRVLADICLQ